MRSLSHSTIIFSIFTLFTLTRSEEQVTVLFEQLDQTGNSHTIFHEYDSDLGTSNWSNRARSTCAQGVLVNQYINKIQKGKSLQKLLLLRFYYSDGSIMIKSTTMLGITAPWNTFSVLALNAQI